MPKPLASLHRFWTAARKVSTDNRGATAIEYGLIIAFIVIGMIVGLSALGVLTSRMWRGVDRSVANVMAR